MATTTVGNNANNNNKQQCQKQEATMATTTTGGNNAAHRVVLSDAVQDFRHAFESSSSADSRVFAYTGLASMS